MAKKGCSGWLYCQQPVFTELSAECEQNAFRDMLKQEINHAKTFCGQNAVCYPDNPFQGKN